MAMYRFEILHGRHDRLQKGDIVETDINLIKYYPHKFAVAPEVAPVEPQTETTVEETTEETTKVEETEGSQETATTETPQIEIRKRVMVHRGRGKYNVYELEMEDFMELDSYDQIDDVGELIAEGLTKAKATEFIN